jgi:RNA polymerase sigma-70 factor (ECF subfamily)
VTSHFTSCIGPDEMMDIYAVFLSQLLANDMRKLRSFDPERGSRFGSWIGMLAINCAYDYLRALRREANLAPLSEAEDVFWDGLSPVDTLELKERARLVSDLLRDFSAKDREFMTLYCEGLEAEEIADKMRISLKTVYSKKHKIQSRLEAMLEGSRMAA